MKMLRADLVTQKKEIQLKRRASGYVRDKQQT